VLRVVRHNVGADEIRGNQGDDGQKKLQGPAQQGETAGAASKIRVGFERDVVRAMRGQVTSASTAMSTVYQSRMPIRELSLKFVQSGSKK